MAGGAGRPELREAHDAALVRDVAGLAARARVRAGEGEPCLAVVIEAYPHPGSDLVAVGAAGFLHPLGELSRVRVRVAGVATRDVARRMELRQADRVLAAPLQDPGSDRRGARLELRLGAMAEDARHRLVRAEQRPAHVVLCLEARRTEPLLRVTGIAGGGGASRLAQLTEVGVDVTRGATGEGEPLELRLHSRERPVAALAGDGGVGTPQREVRLLVELTLAGRAVQDQPALHRVAALAILAELVRVRILVALEAARVGDRLHARKRLRARGRKGIFHEGRIALLRMAGEALDAGVLPLQREGGAGVVEARSRLPASFVVAVAAGGAELPAMLVEVTVRAPGAEAEMRVAPRVGGEQIADALVHDQPLLVALCAVDLGVLPVERESRALVIEALLPLLAPVDELEVAALVVVMAFVASPIGVGDPAVEALVLRHPIPDLGVAVETALIGELGAGDVALRAVVEPLQLRVAVRERTGRKDVGSRGGGETEGGAERRGEATHLQCLHP